MFWVYTSKVYPQKVSEYSMTLGEAHIIHLQGSSGSIT